MSYTVKDLNIILNKLPSRASGAMVAGQHRALHPRAVHQDADVGVDQVLVVIEGVHLNVKMLLNSLL